MARPAPSKKPKKPLSPTALRRLAASRAARERSTVLRELRHFGNLCDCGHFREVHNEEEGICESCWDSRVKAHKFTSLYRLARRYFRSVPPDDLSIALDAGGSGMVEYGGNPAAALRRVPQGETAMAKTTTAKGARVKRSAPSRVTPPPRSTKPAPEKPKAQPETSSANRCLCGCGGETRSRFVPGHDAKLKSQLTNIALDPTVSAKERARAAKRMEELGWGELLEKSRASREAKAEKAARQPAKGTRTAAQKAATERMRAAQKRKAADEDEDEDEDVEEIGEDSEDEDSEDLDEDEDSDVEYGDEDDDEDDE